MSKLLEQINKTKQYSLGEVCIPSGGGTPSTTVEEYWNGDIPWLTPTEISGVDFCFVADTKRKITKKGLESSSAKLMPVNSILMSSRANIGDVVINTVPMATNQGFINIIPNKDIIDIIYFSYWLRTRKNYFIQVSTGSTFLELSKSTFKEIPIDLPTLPTQKKIAEILSAYDAKIENNNKIIKNLEATAQAIFNEWFVNFRFPGYEKVKMVESEMGKIPEGWEVSSLGQVSNNHDSKRIPLSSMERNKRKGSIPYYGANGILDYVDKPIFSGEFLLFAEDGTVKMSKNLPVIYLVDGDFWVNNHAHIISGNKVSNYFLYLSLCKINIDQYITGGVQPKITQQNLNSIPILIPDQNLLSRFEKIIKPLFQQILLNQKENISLKSQRDQLLTKLI